MGQQILIPYKPSARKPQCFQGDLGVQVRRASNMKILLPKLHTEVWHINPQVNIWHIFKKIMQHLKYTCQTSINYNWNPTLISSPKHNIKLTKCAMVMIYIKTGKSLAYISISQWHTFKWALWTVTHKQHFEMQMILYSREINGRK